MKISTILLCALLFGFGFAAGFPWGMVLQFSKLSVPVMGVLK